MAVGSNKYIFLLNLYDMNQEEKHSNKIGHIQGATTSVISEPELGNTIAT